MHGWCVVFLFMIEGTITRSTYGTPCSTYTMYGINWKKHQRSFNRRPYRYDTLTYKTHLSPIHIFHGAQIRWAWLILRTASSSSSSSSEHYIHCGNNKKRDEKKNIVNWNTLDKCIMLQARVRVQFTSGPYIYIYRSIVNNKMAPETYNIWFWSDSRVQSISNSLCWPGMPIEMVRIAISYR